MKPLRYYFISSLIWVALSMVALASISCSKTSTNSATNCDAYGNCYVNGTWVPGGGVGTGTNSIPYLSSPNGSISNRPRFDDLDLLIFPYPMYPYTAYHCQSFYSNYGYDSCEDIQVGLKVSGTNYGIALVAGALANTVIGSGIPGSVIIGATILNQNSTATVYGVYETNPYSHLVLTLNVAGTATNTTRNYQLYYWTNANSYLVASGTMSKGVDYQ
jgi:hypothetical protein